jgi:2-haloacid dehalogenase
MTHKITAIIFDLGNVLIGWDVYRLYDRLLPDREAVDRFLEQTRFMEWNAKQDAGRSFREGVADLSSQFPHYAELIQAYDIHWKESLTPPYEETVQILRDLKQAGWSLYLLSNFSVEKFNIVKNQFDFFDLFDDMIISGEHKTVKPEPAIFEIILSRIGKSAEECIFIDDSLPNIETARAMGFHAIHFTSPTQLKAELINLDIKGIN